MSQKLFVVILLVFSVVIISQPNRELIGKGQEYMRKGSYEMAIKTLEKATDVKKSHLGVESLIDVYRLTGKYQKALALASLLQKSADANAASRGMMQAGEIFLTLGQFGKAEDQFLAARISNAENIRIQVDLGLCYLKKGNREKYIEVFADVFDNYDPDLNYTAEDLTYVGIACRYYAMNSDEVDRSDTLKTVIGDILPDAIKKNPYEFTAYIQTAEIFLEAFNAIDAKSTLKDALKLNPQHPGLLLCKAMLQWQKYSMRPKVIPTLKNALGINPQLADALALGAMVHLSDEEYSKAYKKLQQALKINANHMDALCFLASYHYLRGETSAYEKVRKKVFTINPKYGEFYYILALVIGHKHQYEDAAKFSRKAVKLNPFLWHAYIELGANLFRTGNEVEAEKYFKTVQEEYNFHTQTHNMLLLLKKYKEFKVFHTPHFKIRLHISDVDIMLPLVTKLLEDFYQHFAKLYKFEPGSKILFEMFPDFRDFGVRAIGIVFPGALGVCFGKVVAQNSPRAFRPGRMNWASVACHEFAHVITLQLSGFKVPRWFTEGLSELSERDRNPSCLRELDEQLYSAYTSGRMRGMKTLNAGFTRPKYGMEVVVCYYQAGLICYYIREKFGFDKIIKMLKLYGQDKKDRQVFKEALNVTLEEFDKQFLAWLNKNVFAKVNVMPTISNDQMEDLKDRIEENPEDVEAYKKLSIGYLQRRKLKDAETNAGFLMAMDPESVTALEVLGRIDYFRKKDKQAMKTLQEAVDQGSKDFRTQLLLGILYSKNKQYDKAIKALKGAKKSFPNYLKGSNPYHLLASIYKAQGKKDLERKEMLEFVKLEGNSFKLRLDLATAFAKEGNYKKAAKFLDEIQDIYPMHIKFQMLCAETFKKLKNWQKTARAYEAILALKPKKDKHIIHTDVAEMYMRLKKNQKAKEHLMQALRLSPGYKRAQQLLEDLK